MGNRMSARILMVVALAGILGVAGYAFAQSDWGSGHHRGGYRMGPGENCPGWGGGRGPGMGYQSGLSQEDAEKLDALRKSFRDETRPLREDLYQKELALRGELAKQDPDAQKAAGLQKEISKLRADFDAKRLAHRIEVKKQVPDAGFGPGSNGGRKHRRGGGYGPGGCLR